MKSRPAEFSFHRRSFLASGGGFAVGAASLAGIATLPAAEAKPPRCASDASSDGFHSTWGSLRLALLEAGNQRLALPLIIRSPDGGATIDLSGSNPQIRLGRGASELLLEPKGLKLAGDRRMRPWNGDSVAALLAHLSARQDLQRDLFALRTAVFAAYPEYLARTGATTFKALAQQQARSAARIAAFGRKPTSNERCRVETVVEETTRTVRTTVELIVSAAERYAACSERCDRRFLSRGREDVVGFTLCEADCLASGFVDLVVGTVELVETLVETVTRQVLECSGKAIKDHWIDPFRGRFDVSPQAGLLAGASAVQSAIPAELLPKAIDVLVKMVKNFPAAIQCVANGRWSITELQTVGVEIEGVGQVPLGITVCMDHDCAMKLLGAGLAADAFSIINQLIVLGTETSVAALVAQAGLTGAAAAVATQVVLGMLAVLIVLMVHLLIVAGQIVVYESLGLIEEGICITHPSLPVILAGVANPLLGLLALGNMPLIVTPRD
ncbi:hypothetical protein [Aquimonas voraii]|uniref:Uncharacterized protein n=1 Tax=Aquimonas voraii TaxID=265719 RepID=A0A1G6UC35_9GAMM|nr:hypothetical protein [Aquimonas voraii]SDD38157.1 hypothetical protein SAMN04488509_102238 [Aquimonas voraii]